MIHEVGGKVPVSGASLHLTGGELRDTAIPRLVVWATPCGGIWLLSKKAVTDEAAAFLLFSGSFRTRSGWPLVKREMAR